MGICDADTLEQVLSKRDVKVYTEDKEEAGCKTNLKAKTIDELLSRGVRQNNIAILLRDWWLGAEIYHCVSDRSWGMGGSRWLLW